ncbi:MAG: 30S ribosomal protein S8 [Myxococcales bacterium]|nr:30S ribosomal protein S8 [Myxococcales bacterium]
MVMTDPVADMLTRIRNANRARHDLVEMPNSKIKEAIAKILKEEGYIKAFRVTPEGQQGMLKIYLRYRENGSPSITQIRRLSKPGLRRYVGSQDVQAVLGGMGVSILTTSQGLMTGKKAKELNVGGELLLEVW